MPWGLKASQRKGNSARSLTWIMSSLYRSVTQAAFQIADSSTAGSRFTLSKLRNWKKKQRRVSVPTCKNEADWVDSAEVLTHLCFHCQSLWAACWLTEKVPLSSSHPTLGCWLLLRHGLWMSPPTPTCGETTQIISYVKYDVVRLQKLQEHPVYCRSSYSHFILLLTGVEFLSHSVRWGTWSLYSFLCRWLWKAAHSTSRWQAHVQMARTRDR